MLGVKNKNLPPLHLPLKVRGRKRGLLKFPQGFLWGAATSAYQVEGGITNNDWAVSDRVPRAGLACDHYHRYEEDFKLAKNLGHNAHRLSLEWSRIEPEEDKWDEEALEHYFHVLDYLKRHGFTTFVTLHHFTNPVWVAADGGWVNRQTIDRFGNYVSKIAQTLGQYIDFWVTINEPGIYAGLSFAEGLWPPFARSLPKTLRVFYHLLDAHNRAYEIIHAYYPEAKVGFAQNITFNEPADKKSFFDKLAVKLMDWLGVEFPYHHTHNDFLGVNHYFHNRLKFVFRPEKHFLEMEHKSQEFTDRGWEIYPKSLYEVLLGLKKFEKPIYITENGLADAEDRKRARYITEYLRAAHRAIKGGVDVRGYLHWSLLDNFEWEDGYKWKFGLVKVDFETQKRTVRKSARVYAKICKSNSLEL